MSRALVAALVAALALAGCGGGDDGERAPATPTTANLWVAPTAGASPKRCATPCAYDPARAYGSFQAAYSAASGGDTIRVKAGAYGNQDITSDNGDLSSMVTFQAAAGETVTMNRLTTDVDWITVKDMEITAAAKDGRGWYSHGHHVTLDHVDISGAEAVAAIGGSDVSYLNAGLGTRGNTTARRCSFNNPEPMQMDAALRVVVSNVDFWPFIPELNGAACGENDHNMHLETVRINAGSHHIRIDRARFHRGDGSGSARLFVSGAKISDLVVANAWFARPDAAGATGTAIHVGAGFPASCDGFVVAYSLIEGAIDDAGCPVKPAYIGNLSPQPDYLPCPGSSASHNLWVWTAAKSGCGTDRWLVHDDPKLDAYQLAPDGYHLTASSPAIDAGEEELCQRYTGGVDIDGQRRKPPCDAGPDEYVP